MKVDDLLANWEKDSKLDKDHLDDEALKIDELHFKYTRMIILENVKLAKIKNKYNEKYNELWIFYTQGAKTPKTIEEIKKAAGGALLKVDADRRIQADEDFQQVSLEVALQTEICAALKSIIWSITKRNENIKSFISFRKLMEGN